ncbi:hypothetical protein [Caldicellulosiruptor saccharolyticus]|uniref:hypothetical protein n=1 Tax=Caldicellulosiruptor saccharolyticus TaxID=44001 RepID=UPI0005A056D0|nr:hypothetical protein [Caldicellulosiruptor saccharolyticus]
MLRKTFSATVRTFIVDQIGIVEVIGVAFLLFFLIFILGKPLQNIGTTLGTSFNILNGKMDNNLNYLNQIQ